MARAVLAIQGQDPGPTRLAFRARSRRVTAADVDRARNEERSLLRAWLMRQTAHVIATEDAGWLLPLFDPMFHARSTRRLTQLGMGVAEQRRAVRRVRRWLADGPVPRRELYRRLTDSGHEASGQRVYHLMGIVTSSGFACLGPDRGSQQTVVLRDDWIGPPPPVSREDALAELARRYLGAYAPATERDLARWAGLPLRDCRLGFARIGPEIREVRLDGSVAWAPKGRARRAPAVPIVRLLGAFDNYNLGYVSRAFAADAEAVKRIIPGGGVVNPTVTVDGRFVATWSAKRTGDRLAVTVEPFTRLDDALTPAIAAEVEDIGRFEGVPAILSG